MAAALTEVDLPGLEKVAKGKVRDVFKLDDKTLLFVASDRVSAFDVVMENGIPDRGAILTLTSAHWFQVLTERIPGLKTHVVSLELPAGANLSDAERALIRHRSMQVRKLEVFPIEAIVRGYITGGAWKEYEVHGTVHGIKVAEGMKLSQAFPAAMYTPSTKAEQGQHDENIHPSQVASLIGEKYARIIEDLALKIYATAREYAAERGIIIADTKFEFGRQEDGQVVLVDEVLTPDSSRFWPKDRYEVGRDQESFDKQFIRDWLIENGLRAKEGVTLPDEVCKATAERYREAFLMLTGKTFEEATKN
jgi:phosphoribosylaminoimidazole-succinocarboxamide synthase